MLAKPLYSTVSAMGGSLRHVERGVGYFTSYRILPRPLLDVWVASPSMETVTPQIRASEYTKIKVSDGAAVVLVLNNDR